MRDLKIGIIDDHNLFVKGFTLLLKSIVSEFKIDVCIESVNEKDFFHKLSKIETDLVIIDLNLENSDGIELIKAIKEKYPKTKVLVVTMIKESKFIREAFKNGADGYISKETDLKDVTDAIEIVMKGDVHFGKGIEAVNKKASLITEKENEAYFNRFNAKFNLTKRELEILAMLVEGKTSKEISSVLFISKDTVNVHRKNLMKKLNISNVVMLVKIVKDYNIL
ncbi:MAG: response regulator transcription factor [Saprospiraceae bacterium]